MVLVLVCVLSCVYPIEAVFAMKSEFLLRKK
jgi:hypothetical protein